MRPPCEGTPEMIDPRGIIDEFCDLVRIDSPSLREAEVVAAIRDRLAEIGVESETDGASEAVGSEVGNLIARVPGDTNAPTVLINAHVDTVEPGRGICPRVEGTVIRSDGTTVLGADDKSGVTIILAMLRHVLGEGLPHPPLESPRCRWAASTMRRPPTSASSRAAEPPTSSPSLPWSGARRAVTTTGSSSARRT